MSRCIGLIAYQRAIPAIEGLLPAPANEVVMTLLYRIAEWHALAKLRMHTEDSLTRLETVTVQLGSEMRRFVKDVCSIFDTYELPRETVQRVRRSAQRTQATRPVPAPSAQESASSPRKRKTFNLATYKYHSLADYPSWIRRCGTTDGDSTEVVCASGFMSSVACS